MQLRLVVPRYRVRSTVKPIYCSLPDLRFVAVCVWPYHSLYWALMEMKTIEFTIIN